MRRQQSPVGIRQGSFPNHSLFTLDSTFRRSGGGEIARVGEATLLTPPSDILRDLLSASVLAVTRFQSWRKNSLCGEDGVRCWSGFE